MTKEQENRKRWREKNPDRVREGDKNYEQSKKRRMRRFLRALREDPCTDCGNTYPWYVMTFDHIDGKPRKSRRTEGRGGVGVSCGTWNRLLNDLSLCELVCANCHMIRTYKRNPWGEGE